MDWSSILWSCFAAILFIYLFIFITACAENFLFDCALMLCCYSAHVEYFSVQSEIF